MNQLASEALVDAGKFDKEKRLYDDTATWLAETLDGTMSTPFEYTFDGKELFGRDGGSIKEIIDDGVEQAWKLPGNLSFEVRRRRHERDEYDDMVQMMQGADFNTIVVVSDFPPELMNETEDVGFYNAERKQTMLRVLTRTEAGTLLMRTHTLDLSDRTALEALYAQYGLVPQEGELLGQRMHLQLDTESQEFLPEVLTGAYDRSLAERFGGLWYAGQEGKKRVNTYDFVRAQRDLLSVYIQAVQKHGENEELLYDIAATMEKRYASQMSSTIEARSYDDNPLAQRQLVDEINSAGLDAQRAGKSYSGCGLSVGSDTLDTQQQLSEAGYGNKTEESTSYKFNKRMYCVVCQAPPKGDETKKMCGPCGICRPCDKKLK